MTLFTWAYERARRDALRAWKLSPHGQRTSRRKRAVWATAAALRVEAGTIGVPNNGGDRG